MHFDRWQRWGVSLDDVSFANAWVALGLAAWPGTLSTKTLTHRSSGPFLEWAFPDPAAPIEGTPQEWAQAWHDLHAQLKAPVRLRVLGGPFEEPLLPWYRMLGEARPAPDAVSLATLAPRASLELHWPLDVGSLTDASWRVLEQIAARKLWPSWKVAKMAKLGREQANCDVLLHRGSLKSLVQHLLDLPYGIKANLVVAHGDAADWGEQRALLGTVLATTRASGFALVPAATDDTALAEMLNGLGAELSHARTPDVALSLAARPDARFARRASVDLVAGITEELAAFVLPDLARRMNARLAAMPAGTEVVLARGGRVAAAAVRVKPEEMTFAHEREGGAELAEMGEAVAAASVPAEARGRRAARFLQQKSFVRPDRQLQEAKEGFLADAPAIVRVRIGVPEAGWDASPAAFPVEALPPDLERWTLTVWLTEPDHLAEPLKRQIRLPREGNSTEAEFRFQPRDLGRFEGRLTVLHRGRVIQTAVLRAGVISAKFPAAKDGEPRLAEGIAVRHDTGELDARREFDVALVANHDSKGRPLLAAVSAKAAWVKDLSQLADVAKQINASLAPVALSVADYAEGLDGRNGQALLLKLARHGNWLKTYLDETLEDSANNPASAKAEYIQIVSTRPDAVVPLEFVYDYTVPEDDAKVCKDWRKALKAGQCPKTCDHDSPKTVCPLGFWGLRKVIERHAVRPGLAKDGNVLYLQSEPGRGRDKLFVGGAAVLGASERVEKADMTALGLTLEKHCGAKPRLAKDWDAWEALVKALHPALLVALPHTDGKATDVTVEIGGRTRKTITLRDAHVFPPPTEGRQAPLVALIGCDVAGTADDYGNHVVVFRSRGAAIVIGTIATVFGKHASQVAGKLVEGMLPAGAAKPVRLGELMREVRRNALLANLLMPLCLVAYGDADWILARKPDD